MDLLWTSRTSRTSLLELLELQDLLELELQEELQNSRNFEIVLVTLPSADRCIILINDK